MTDEERRAAREALGLEPIRLRLADFMEPIDLRDRLVARYAELPSPVGQLVVCWNQLGVSWVRTLAPGQDVDEAARAAGRPARREAEPPAWLRRAVAALDGSVPMPHVRVDLASMGEFQRAVLRATQSIPRGQTRPYAWVAEQLGSPRAVRAVGTALARNPVPLVVPCHRVVRSDGSLGQYVFGTPVKQRLLAWEAAQSS